MSKITIESILNSGETIDFSEVKLAIVNEDFKELSLEEIEKLLGKVHSDFRALFSNIESDLQRKVCIAALEQRIKYLNEPEIEMFLEDLPRINANEILQVFYKLCARALQEIIEEEKQKIATTGSTYKSQLSTKKKMNLRMQ